MIEYLQQNGIDLALRVLGALVVLVVGLLLTKIITKKLSGKDHFKKLDPSAKKLLFNIVRIVLYVVVIVIAVQIVGVPSATIIALISSCGLAIGLALQGGLSNIAGGVVILITKPFRIGDFITAAGEDGTVTDIGIFYTKITTIDNKVVNVPNATAANSTIVNYTENDTRRIDLPLAVAYDTDIEKAKKALCACAQASDFILQDPAPAAFVTAHESSSVTVTVRFWVKKENYWDAKFEMLENSKLAFDKLGIRIPFQQVDVHVKDDNDSLPSPKSENKEG